MIDFEGINQAALRGGRALVQEPNSGRQVSGLGIHRP
jgi:hypothetical protein